MKTRPDCVRFMERAAIFAFLLAFTFVAAHGQQLSIDQLSKNVWKRIYNATQADDPQWLAADDDGDGLTNGEEIAAGTDPFSPGSTLQISDTTVSGGLVHFTFPTLKGKFYTLQKSTNISNPSSWTAVVPAAQVKGTNNDATLDAPYAVNTFFRVLVQDVDTDGDGVSDWAEMKLGLDPNSTQSNGSTDAYGRPLLDSEYASNNFNGENIVTVSAVGDDAQATQPDAGQTATDLGAFTITRTGLPTVLKAATVNLTIAGNAVAGQAYQALPSSVLMPAGVRTVTLSVVPLAANGATALKAPVTVSVAIQPGGGYTVGSGALAGVTISPSNTPTGSGLTGVYYNNAATPYASTVNFNPANQVATRTDATVDFKWSATQGTSAGLPAGVTPSSFCVRWTGQVQPQYTETYFFDVYARQGCVLKVGGQTIINNWSNLTTLTDMVGSITLQAGLRYDIQLDYFSNSGNAVSETHLQWYSNSQPKQVIPTGRLYPATSGATAAPPTITSSPVAYAFLNQPFSFDITTGSGQANTTIAITGGTLPAGLTYSQTLSATTGLPIGRISGTPTQAGDFQLVVTATNTAGSGSAALELQVLDSGNGITKEVWTNLSGSGVASIPTGTTPNLTANVTSFEDTDTSYGDNYGVRMRGYVMVPTSGFYYYWIASSGASELWISNDDEPVNKVKRATSAGTTSRKWSAAASQKSGWLELQAGIKYYVEVLHRGTTASANNLAIGFKADATGNNTALADGAGVVPGYLLWKYYAPAIAYSSDGSGAGDLFFTKMSSEGGAVTTASGLCTLRLNAAGTQATVRFNYAGLTTAVTGKHIHNDPYLTNPSQIIFDMDTAVPNSDGSYTWDLAPVGTFTKASDIVQCIREGKTYINIHTVNYPNGEIRGNLTIANGAQQFVPPAAPPSFTLPSSPSDAEAARFLTQATFGPNPADIAAVKASGFPAWIDAQFAVTPTHMMNNVFNTQDVNNRYPDEQVYNGFWRNSITAQDQLRQRVAFSLSQIMVTSFIGLLDNNSRAVGSYYDVLVDNAFSNYRTLLKNVTLHPAMGRYLDMLGNRNGDITTGRIPNENYAREINQLFSIGLNRLWPDGSLILDSKFSPIPTYDQSVIQGYARVFTGWNYAQPRQGNNRLPVNFGSYNDLTGWLQPMSLFPANGTAGTSTVYHELGSKKLLNNTWLPAATVTAPNTTFTDTDPTSPYYGENMFDRNGLIDLDRALDAIFYNDNVGPFICRQLIQRLVTSNPSPGYVYRVVQAFNGERTWDGRVTGVRGDLKEVVKAILLDYEARSTAMLASSTFGKQREPILRVTTPARYFLSKPVSGTFTQSSTYNATTNPFPNRIRVDIQGDLLVGINEWVALRFNSLSSGSPLPPSTIDTRNWYWTRTAPTFTQAGASAPRTNPSLYVDAFGVMGATYRQAGALVPATVDINADTFTATAHGLTAGQLVYIVSSGTIPGGVSASTQYFVKNPTANTFQISLTNNGTAVNLTSVGSGTIYFQLTSGTTITLSGFTTGGVSSGATTHNIPLGGSVYLRFFGAGAPADGIYTVSSLIPASSSAYNGTIFTVTAGSSGSSNGQPACLTRLQSCSYTPSTTTINVYSPVPHGLVTGNQVYITDNSGTSLPITGKYSVTNVPNGTDGLPDPYRFQIAYNGTGNTSLAISNMWVFPLVAPNLDRTGTLDFYNSTWIMNQTDQDSTTASLGQTPMRSTTVFNFYYPDYAYPGDLALNGVTTPEFQLTSDTNIMLLTNFIEQGIQASGLSDGRTSFRSGGGAIVLDMSALCTTAYTSNANIGLLVDKLNVELMGGTMSTAMRNAIVAYVGNTANFPYTTPTTTQMRDRVRAVVHLILTSTEFAIQR